MLNKNSDFNSNGTYSVCFLGQTDHNKQGNNREAEHPEVSSKWRVSSCVLVKAYAQVGDRGTTEEEIN